jgi:hypothetical protein
VDYPVRTRHGGSVFFFNFRLARHMGLIPANHPDEMTPALEAKLLETFAIVIINEYDIMNEVHYPAKDIRENKYMATRYLQLQHPNKQGKTSGDGRGIWNGEFKHKGTTWDVSSSGTGATKLSPAHAQTNKFFKTGDTKVGYGNGYNSVVDGMSAALMSDIFHQNGIETEQTLVIISFEAGTSINVRAGKNLFRPAHFFRHLKLSNREGLKSSVDFFMDRQMKNGDAFLTLKNASDQVRYTELADEMARTFSKISAQYESDYIFCWLDWDGDNILANGGIIDYGSIRQFGLYHREYRYDDVDRMSTNIPEQKIKARYIVQNFCQIRDFLITGVKKPLNDYRNDPALKLFDRNLETVAHQLLLKKIGLSEKHSAHILKNFPGLIRQFKKHHSFFESCMSTKGIYKIADGVTRDAVFCMQAIHKELPKRILNGNLSAEAFIEVIKSSYAKRKDLRITRYRAHEAKQFQKYYAKIMKQVSHEFHRADLKHTLLEATMRASVLNREDRITGDGVLHVTSSLLRNQQKLTFDEKHQVIDQIIQHQVIPDFKKSKAVAPEPAVIDQETMSGRIVHRNLKAIRLYRESF